jgi:hypothetical protein
MRSRPEMGRPKIKKSGAVSLMIQTTESKSRMRIPIAARSPIRRAGPCCDPGSLLDRIEMKMTLSTPSTISRNVSVMSASRLEEVKNVSMVTALP